MTANLLGLCWKCHAWVESHREEALLSGLLLRQGQSPEDEPVQLWRGWVYLDNNAGFTPA